MEAKKVQSSGRVGGIFLIIAGVVYGLLIIWTMGLNGPPNTVFTGSAITIDPQGGTYHISGSGVINYKMVSDDCFTLEKDDFMGIVKGCGGDAPLGWNHYTSGWWKNLFPTYSEASGIISPGGWHFTQGSAVMILTSDQPISVIVTPSQMTLIVTWGLTIFMLVMVIVMVLIGIWLIKTSEPDKKPEEKPKEPEEQNKE